jgi:hypothetical protein
MNPIRVTDVHVCPIYGRISWAYFLSSEALISQSVRLHEKHVELKMYVSDRKFSMYLNPAKCSQSLLIGVGVEGLNVCTHYIP